MNKIETSLTLAHPLARSSVSPYTLALQTLGLAVAYFATGKLGTYLAIPPGYATAIWPPSGIALAGVLLFGYRVWPGILLGSILVNFSTNIVGVSPSGIIISVMIALAIGSGAALQALIGAYLVKRFAGFPNQLASIKEVALFMLFGGLLSSLINSTIAVTFLVVIGRIPLANALFNWSTWWAGDTIGILIFTPLVLIWVLSPAEHWRDRRMMITLTTLSAFVLTTVLVLYAAQKEQEHLRLEFERDATAMKVALEKSLLTHITVLQSLESFFAASENVDQAGFKAFVVHSLDNLHGIQALEWSPRILSSERNAFERSMQKEGVGSFGITERDNLKQLIRAGSRSEYIPVTFIEPYKGNESALGYDVYSDAIRREAINRARDTGEIATTARITLVQEKKINEFGILAFTPIYRKGLSASTTEDRRRNILGYAVAVFRGGDIVTAALKEVNRDNLSYRLLDNNAPTGLQLLYTNNIGNLKPIILKEKGLFGKHVNLESNSIIPIGGRQWRFEITPTQSYIAAHRTDNEWLILLGGLLLTSMLGAFVMILSGRDNILRKLVEERTLKLQSESEKNLALLRNASDGIHILDHDGNIVEASDSFCEMLGYCREEVIGMNVSNWDVGFVNVEEQLVVVRQQFNNTIRSQFESKHKRKDGTIFCVEVSGFPLELDGVPLLFNSSRDITQRHQVEAKFHGLFEQSSFLAGILDQHGNLVNVNNKALNLIGISRDDVLGKYFPDTPWWINENDRAHLIEVLSDVLAGEEASFETIHPTIDGGIIHILFSATPITLESGRYISVIGVDITQQKLAEEALRVSEQQFRNFFEKNSSVMLLIEPISGDIVTANIAAQNYYGYLMADMVGMNISNINTMSPERIAEERMSALHEKHNYFTFTHRLASGELRDIEAHTTPMESRGRMLLFTIVHDITDRKHAEQAFKESEYRWKFAIEGSGDGLWDWNVAESTVFFSKRWKRMLGYDDDDIGNDLDEWEKRIHPNDLAMTISRVQAHLHGSASTYISEHRVLCKDGGYKWILDRGLVVSRDKSGKALRMIGTHTDITVLKQSESELRIAAIAFESQEGMLVTDADNAILRVNRAFTSITGYTAEEVIGKNPHILSSGRHDAAFYDEMWKAINDNGEWAGEIWNQRKNGDIYPEHLTITAVKNDKGLITNYVATLTDVTLSKAAADEIQHLAFYDPLTRLPNRRLLIDRLKQALVASGRSGWEGALLFIDLDYFKTLNDTLGHDIGDLLLQQVASRLSECVREGDTVARMGGDEFVVLLEGLSEQPIEAAAQTKVIGDKILVSLNQPYHLASHKHYSTPSIGATLFNDHQSEIDELLKQADIAMYQAKAAGRNAICFFDQQMQDAINVRASTEIELRKALELQQFKLHYQIQVDDSGRPIGVEALLRWLHPECGLVPPNDFIPLAEETGLILPIGQWVLETACDQLKQWERGATTCDLTISINVSAKQFRQEDFVTQVKRAIVQYAINPMLLKLELTESMLLDNVDRTIATMIALAEIGLRFSLDDFGTRYSSLQYLKQLPLDQLKIDKSFVKDIAFDSSDRAIVRTIIAMAQSLELDVIAEGVETEAQRNLLQSKGCNAYQGYLFGKPVPIEQFEAFLGKD